MRWVIIATLSIIASAPTIWAQSPLCVGLRVQTAPDATREFGTLEGKATASVMLKNGDSFTHFYIDLTIRDQTSGVVHASVRASREPGSPVLDEFDAVVGQTIQTSTVPSFRISVLGIYESTRRGIRDSCESN